MKNYPTGEKGGCGSSRDLEGREVIVRTESSQTLRLRGSSTPFTLLLPPCPETQGSTSHSIPLHQPLLQSDGSPLAEYPGVAVGGKGGRGPGVRFLCGSRGREYTRSLKARKRVYRGLV